MCIYNKLTRDADNTGPGTTLRNTTLAYLPRTSFVEPCIFSDN